MGQGLNDGARPGGMNGSGDQEPLVYLADGGEMVLPNETNLLHADFARRADDLLVDGTDRPALVILDYFAADHMPDLHTEGGAVLPAHVVVKLAGPDLERPAVLAQGEDPATEQAPIGQVETIEGEVIIIRADGSEVVATVGMPVFQDDVIVTGGDGSVGLRFIDGMTLSLGSDARMVLDEFVYDPAAGEGGGIIEIIQGAFSFVSGAAAHMGLDSLVIDTPTMTIGIRGTKVVANAAAEGEITDVVLLPEDDGTIGKIMITTNAGQELLEEAFAATTVTSRFQPPAAQTIVTPDWVYSHYSQPLAALPMATVEENGIVGVEIEAPVLDQHIRFDSERGFRHRDIERAAAEPADGRATPDVLVQAPEQSSERAEPINEGELDQPVLSFDKDFPTIANRDLLDLVEEPDLDQPAPEPETPANQTPIVITPIANTSTTEDAGFSYDISASFTDTDIAGGDALVFSAALNDGSALPPWLSINPTTGVLSGTPANNEVESLIVTVSATDGTGASVSTSFQLTVTNSNDAPLVVTPIADTGAAEDAAFTYDVSSNFADDDAIHGDSLTFSAEQSNGSPLPTWLSIDPATGILSGTPANTDVAGLTLRVTATDAVGAGIHTTFQLTITNTNDAPLVVTPIVDTGAAEDTVFTYDVSSNFADDDSIHGDNLTFSAEQSNGSPLPAWLSIDPATGILSGTPTNADVAGLTLSVVATDDAGSGIASSFQLAITNSNDAPIIVTPIADIAPLENALLTYNVSNSFADDDIVHGDSLTFSAEQNDGSPLPTWLTIDPGTGVLSGTPDAAEVGVSYTINVTATDSSATSATSTFLLSVDNVNDAPVLNVLPSPTLSAVLPGDTDPMGATIADIIVDGSINDADGGAVESIAVTGIDDTNGVWEFSIDSGASWAGIGAVSDTAALLLDGAAMLRFIPDPGFGGSATFTFRAWDQTAGSNGQAGVDVTANGGMTAFSAESDTGSVLVSGGTPDLGSGAEFQVNTETAERQEDPSIAALNDGGFVVTWESKDQDGDGSGIYGQRFNSTGSAVGSEFQVNATSTDEQNEPSVAALNDGGFVITWESKDQDGDKQGVYGQRFDSSGFAVGSEFQVNTATSDNQEAPSVAALNDGGFIIAWQSENQDGDDWGVYGQRYDSTGSAIGSEFQINTTASNEQSELSVAALADGGFVVTWESVDQDGDKRGIYGQRYDSSGSAAGTEFQINTTITDDQEAPTVTGLDDGGFVVVWESDGQDGDGSGIYGQRFDSSGNAVEFEFQINQEIAGDQREPFVSALTDGGFIVTWQSKDQDGDNWGAYGRRFNADGDPLGDEFPINTTTIGEQTKIATATLSNGGLAATWQSRDQDGDDWGIFGHRYDSETASVTINPPQAEAASILDFGGTDSFVDIGDPGQNADDLDPGRGDYTVEAWFYYDGANGRQSIVSKGNDNALDAGFNIFLDNDTLVVRASTDAGLDAAAMKVTMGGSPGWHHVAMVLDQETGFGESRIRGYLDGSDAGWTTGHGIVFTSTVTTSSSLKIETDDRFLIGAADDNGSAEDFFDAEIADVRVWNTARNQEEIEADLGRTLNGDEPHLIANWQLDEGVGLTGSDSTGSYDGTITGSPAWTDALDLTTAQDTVLAGRLSASDDEGDILGYSVLTDAASGTASIDADKGTWTYDPDAGFSGSDSFSYQISDGQGGIDTVTIAVTVTP